MFDINYSKLQTLYRVKTEMRHKCKGHQEYLTELESAGVQFKLSCPAHITWLHQSPRDGTHTNISFRTKTIL